jgi:hypothetical protein
MFLDYVLVFHKDFLSAGLTGEDLGCATVCSWA